MPKDFLAGAREAYDVVVIGSGLAGMTAANILGRAGRSVLLVEQHYKLGGMATWFKRPGGHIFDVSLHGFPYGMIKSCRRYWTEEIADSIVRAQQRIGIIFIGHDVQRDAYLGGPRAHRDVLVQNCMQLLLVPSHEFGSGLDQGAERGGVKLR